jgi:hypothetical protein
MHTHHNHKHHTTHTTHDTQACTQILARQTQAVHSYPSTQALPSGAHLPERPLIHRGACWSLQTLHVLLSFSVHSHQRPSRRVSSAPHTFPHPHPHSFTMISSGDAGLGSPPTNTRLSSSQASQSQSTQRVRGGVHEVGGEVAHTAPLSRALAAEPLEGRGRVSIRATTSSIAAAATTAAADAFEYSYVLAKQLASTATARAALLFRPVLRGRRGTDNTPNTNRFWFRRGSLSSESSGAGPAAITTERLSSHPHYYRDDHLSVLPAVPMRIVLECLRGDVRAAPLTRQQSCTHMHIVSSLRNRNTQGVCALCFPCLFARATNARADTRVYVCVCARTHTHAHTRTHTHTHTHARARAQVAALTCLAGTSRSMHHIVFGCNRHLFTRIGFKGTSFITDSNIEALLDACDPTGTFVSAASLHAQVAHSLPPAPQALLRFES